MHQVVQQLFFLFVGLNHRFFYFSVFTLYNGGRNFSRHGGKSLEKHE